MPKATNKNSAKRTRKASGEKGRVKADPMVRLILRHTDAANRHFAAVNAGSRMVVMPRALERRIIRAAEREAKAFNEVFHAIPSTAAGFEAWAKCVMRRASMLGWVPGVVDFQLMLARIGTVMDRLTAAECA